MGEEGGEARKTSARAYDPQPSPWSLHQQAQASLRLPLTPTHPLNPSKTLGHPQTARLTMGRTDAGPLVCRAVVLSSLQREQADTASSISPPPLCPPFTALISRGPCAAVIYSLSDISPSAAEKSIWS